MKLLLKLFLLVLLIAWAWVLLTGTGLTSDRAFKVLVLPFKINAAQDLTYIQEGILDMISSRLAWEGKVIVLERVLARKEFDQTQGKIDDHTALALGLKTGADYVLYGSLTMIGQSVSLDARIISQLEKKPALTAHTQSDKIDDVIPKINAFVEDINDKIFKRKAQPQVAARKKETPVPSRRHPESLLVRSREQGLFRTPEDFSGAEGFW
ncbi:MAG: hypothetical protein JRI34_13965, partial [Deltaproteobacteria bacterium]|nr:hypothetical protein [Deltaproteobacteria bacterium]